VTVQKTSRRNTVPFRVCRLSSACLFVILASSMLALAQSALNFAPAVTYGSGGYNANSVAVADVNGDSKPDLVVANLCATVTSCNNASGTVGMLLGKGDGTFQPVVTYGSGGYFANSVAVADVNGDGKPDLLVANECADSSNCDTSGSVGVLLGNGDGTFQTAVPYGSGGWGSKSVAVADVNGDGKPDLLVANTCPSTTNCNTSGSVGVLLGNGDGTFQPAVTYGSGGYWPRSVAVADVNGDGKPDLLVANYCGGTSNCSTSGTVGMLLGNGDGTFQPVVTYGSGGLYANSVTVADVNGDGKPDLVAANYLSNNAGVILGNGDGTFQTAVTYGSGGSVYLYSVAVADVNGDGKPDLLAANCGCDNGTVGVLIDITPSPYKAFVQPPINADGSSIFKANRGVIPVKFTLTLNNTPNCTLPPATISVTRTAGGVIGSVDEGTYSMAADNGSNFRIDPTACQYVYNLGASSLGVGTYRVDIRINGIVVGDAVFALR